MSCADPIPFDTLVSYWAADLDPDALEAVEVHLFSCAACTRESARVAAITEALRASLPPLLTPEHYGRLVASGLRCLENPMTPGERKEQDFPANVDLLVHRLGGLDLTNADRVSFLMHPEGSDHVMVALDDVPFDREGGAVLLACQKHFAALPHDTVAEVRVVDRGGAERLATYTILHRFA